MPNKNNDETFQSLKKGIHKFLVKHLGDDESIDDTKEKDDGFFEEDTASEFRVNEAVSQKVRKIINDFIESAPLIEEAGFRIADLEIELSVIPKLIPHFQKISNTDEETRLQILDKVKNKRIISLLLKALFKADNFQQSLKMGTLVFSGIEIEITAIPAVRLLYKNPKQPNINSTDLVK